MNKKVIAMVLILSLLVSSASMPLKAVRASETIKRCLGYSIIEFGKAIDCNGDTILLQRKNGIQVALLNQ